MIVQKAWGIGLVLAAALSSASGNATELRCEAQGRGERIAFRVEGLERAGSPRATFEDAPLMTFTPGERVWSLSFSNQCDNLYELVFFADDLRARSGGELRRMTGILRYRHADLEPGETRTVSVTCR